MCHLDDPQVGVLAGLHVKEMGILEEEGKVRPQGGTGGSKGGTEREQRERTEREQRERTEREQRRGREGTLINE